MGDVVDRAIFTLRTPFEELMFGDLPTVRPGEPVPMPRLGGGQTGRATPANRFAALGDLASVGAGR